MNIKRWEHPEEIDSSLITVVTDDIVHMLVNWVIKDVL